MHRHASRSRSAALLTFAALLAALDAQGPPGTPIGFEETYALAADRAKAVATLIPGTEEWFFFHCRERLDARDFATVRSVLANWIQQHGRTQRVLETENRLALLSFSDDPRATFAFLRERTGVRHEHQRVVPGERSDLPTRLDSSLLSPTNLTQRAFANAPGTVDGFTDRALWSLASTNLTPEQLHSLLARLRRPDVDNLPALVVRDLQRPNGGRFGELSIHRLLRRDQLDECARLRPALLQERAFVDTYLTRLQPSADSDWQVDPAARAAHLTRLHEFAQRLPSSHNSLKANVLFHWLEHDLTQGAPDRDRFLAYLRLPHRSGRVSEAHQRRFQKDFVVLATDYPTGFPPIGDDVTLLRACLEHFFARDDSWEVFAEFLDADWLKQVFAETKLLIGEGDPQRWYAMLANPTYVDRLEQRVEIGFPPTLRTHFTANEPVQLQVDTKNVPTLLVKVFAIDSYRYHQEKQTEVDATIELDGVVANFEQTFSYDEPKLRRVRRTFDLPMLTQPGTYVIEFVGNGLSSRAVVHKGGLRHAQRVMAAGHEFRVYDEAGALRKDAAVWFGGREYAANAEGEILLPFTTEPGEHKVVLKHGTRSSLATFAHATESYQLNAAVHVARESLVAGKTAKVVIRPQLRLGEHAVSTRLLTQPTLTIVATDLDGLSTTQDVRELTLVDGRELVHEIGVPERLAMLQISLRARVRDLAGKDVDLVSATTTVAVNGVDQTPATSNVLLLRTPEGWSLDVRGRDGEAKPGQVCQLRLQHRDYRESVDVSLQTDATGRIALGELAGVQSVHVRQPNGHEETFPLEPARARLPESLHGLAGETLRVPYLGNATAPTRAEFTLLGSERDEFARLAIADRFLELRDLAPGDYTLWMHDVGAVIPIRVTAGARDGDWLLGKDRILDASPTQPLHLRSIETTNDELVVRVANQTPSTRVHVVATRHATGFDAFTNLAGVPAADQPVFATERAESTYHAGRQLGDEYRYVLDRRFAKKYPGNMLRRPSLLVNPWAVDDDSENAAIGASGGPGGKYGGRTRSRAGAAPGAPAGDPGLLRFPLGGAYANLDWLPAAAPLHGNLVPDRDGVVRVKLADLGAGQTIHVVAIDGDQIVSDEAIRSEQPVTPRSRRLPQAIDGAQHFVEQKRIEFVAAGGEAVLADARSAQVEIYDSLAAVHRLLTTISRDESLNRFAFVLKWPTFDAKRKRELYSQHACHELAFFLHEKDPEFFVSVVKPLLANKLDKTFLDRWLLDEDLARFLEPWHFEQLNLIERILLAHRLGGDWPASVARTIREAIELRPVPIERLEQLFRVALRGDELTAGFVDTNGFGPTTGSDDYHLGARRAGEVAPAKPGMPPAATAAPSPAPEEAKKQADGKDRQELADLDKGKADEPAGGRDEREKLAEDAERRGQAKQLYRAVESTKLLVEHAYWHRRLEQMTADAVAPNRFWLDYATAPANQPFASSAILEAGSSFLEAMMALAVLDLPFEAGKHDVTVDGDRRTLRAATPLLLVRKEVTKTEVAANQTPLLLGENFFRLDDRYRFVDGEQRDAFVTDEFLTDVAYGCQVVVTNPTSQKRTAELLLQIPAGAVPLQRGFWTRGVPVELQPYATATVEYAFYFPGTGTFAHYPVHAAEKGKLAAFAEPKTLRVVAAPTTIDTTSWEHVSQQGSATDVFTHLDQANVLRLDLTKVAWRMKDKAFFGAMLEKLRARHVYDHTLWSYALLHEDPAATGEFLRHDGFLANCGMAIESPLVTIDPVERRAYQHLELDPLVHQRAHRLRGERRLGNQDLARQYAQFTTLLGYRPQLDSEDWMSVTYYLLLQDRIEEAIAHFAKIDPTKVTTRIQYDYLQCYLALFTGETTTARTTAERHREHPVPHWQSRFADVLAQLDEAEGRTRSGTGEPSVDALAATAPALEFVVEGQTAKVTYRNLPQCEVRYYEIDVEFAFSARPFASDEGSTAAFVQPNQQQVLALPADRTEVTFPLPPAFAKKNVLVEIRGAGLVRSQTSLANALAVRFVESYGQVAVGEPGTNKPLPKAYVKVFAKMPNGTVRFHKDGYTDLRGRFDYASVSDDPDAGAVKYAVLVLDEQRGAVIREMNPPAK